MAEAFDDRPAVVVSLDDEVELVPGVLAELAGIHVPVAVPAEALHVAMSVGPDRRAGERVARRRLARGREPQDLAAQGAAALRAVALAALAGPGVQHPVRSERDPAPVVDRPLRDAGEDHVGRREPPTGV